MMLMAKCKSCIHLLLLSFILAAAANAWAAAKEETQNPEPWSASEYPGGDCSGFLARNKISNPKDCSITEYGELGKVNDQTYRYILYCIIPGYSSEDAKCGDDSFSARYHRSRGLAIYQEELSSKSIKRWLERVDPEIGTVLYSKPLIIENSFGRLFYIPIQVDGTSGGNTSEYFIQNRAAGEWEALDGEGWTKALLKRLPSGLGIWKGIWPDLKTMTAKAGLYREHDANCCPSGGTAFIELGIKQNRFVLKSIRFEKSSVASPK
jgi:hypothetical protein